MISLALDGMTGGLQDKIRTEYKTQTYTMMLACNVWSILYLGIGKYSILSNLTYTRIRRCLFNKVVTSGGKYFLCFFSVTALLVTGEGMEFLAFAFKYPEVLVQMLTFSISSAIGQVKSI